MAGRLLVDDRRVVGVTEHALWEELVDWLLAHTDHQRDRIAMLRRLVPELADWYARGGHIARPT